MHNNPEANVIIDLINKLPPTGPNGFEGLIASLLESLTGRRFFLAKSGTQGGRDISSGRNFSSVVAVECKRYSEKTELNERSLLGGLSQALRDIPDLDIWVLVTSRSVNSQLINNLSDTARQNGIEFGLICSNDDFPNTLEILCAQAEKKVFKYLEPTISESEKQAILIKIKDISTSPNFGEMVEKLKQEFSPFVIGYDHFRVDLHKWLISRFCSENKSRDFFGQSINVGDDSAGLVERKLAWLNLDQWLSDWRDLKQPFFLLGEEGDGKTWAAASWLYHSILTEDNFPPVLFFSSSAPESTDPATLISKFLSKRSCDFNEQFWQKRLNRWLQKSSENHPLFLLVLDGINERRSPLWWRELIEKLQSDPWQNKVAVLITCRNNYFQQHFIPLRHIQIRHWILPPYSDEELALALKKHSLNPSDIPQTVLPLLRKPRYLDLVVKYKTKIGECGDITPARLIYEDWKDRLARKRNLSLDDNAFQGFIKDLASKHKKGNTFITGRELEELLPLISEKLEFINELTTSRILQSKGNHFQVDSERLAMGLGLLLYDEIDQALTNSDDVSIEDVILSWVEPYTEIDLKAKICEWAVLQALSTPEFSLDGKVALLKTWVNCKNPDNKIEQNFSAYFPQSPKTYIRLAEFIWSDDSDKNHWTEEIIMSTFLRWRSLASASKEFLEAFERWLGFVQIDGHPFLRRPQKGETAELKNAIKKHLDKEITLGTFEFAGYHFTAINNDNLLRLGRVAIAVISHLPKKPWIRALVIGCLADEVMDFNEKYDLISWTIRASHEPIWLELHPEVQKLLKVQKIAAKRAVSRLLYFESSEEAFQLKKILPDNLFPTNLLWERYKSDPCTSGLQWRREDCMPCMERKDLTAEKIAKNIRAYCTDPKFRVPVNLGSRLAFLTEILQVDKVWSGFGSSLVDILLEESEPALCAYNPHALADFIRKVIHQLEIRSDKALSRSSIEFKKYFLIFDRKEWGSLIHSWEILNGKNSGLDRQEKYTEANLFQLVLKQLESEEQLDRIIERNESFWDLVRFQNSFKELKNLDFILEKLNNLSETKKILRFLWFISTHANTISIEILSKISCFITHEDSSARGYAIKVMYFSKNEYYIERFVKGSWGWSKNNNWEENHWGSMILCEYGNTISYSDLRNRIHPIYIGSSLKRRGLIQSEIHQYAEDIHKIWLLITRNSSEFSLDFPSCEIEYEKNDTEMGEIEIIHLSQELFGSHKMVSREFFWGGVVGPNLWQKTKYEIMKDSDYLDKLQKIIEETVEEQKEAGNEWFGHRFYSYALDSVCDSRPDLLEEWLKPLLENQKESKRIFLFGKSFYEALCKILLEKIPEKGVALYRIIKDDMYGIRFTEKYSGIQLLDHSLFSAPHTEIIENCWNEFFLKCKTDQELMDLALLIKNRTSEKWLFKKIQTDLVSQVLFVKARSIVLLGFVDDKKTGRILRKLLATEKSPFINKVVERALELWQRNQWAKYWFAKFLSVENDITAWASFRLFLRCVDRRFYNWQKKIDVLLQKNNKLEKRFDFLEENSEVIKENSKNNEKKLGETFLDEKVLTNQVWPWME